MRMSRRWWHMAAALTVMTVSGTTLADEVTEQIETARKDYLAGDLPNAVSGLEFALEALRRKQGEAFLAAFPEPASGWELEPTSKDTAATVPLAGTVLQRVYRQIGGNGRIEAQLMTGGSILQGFAAMLTNPQFLAVQPGAKRIRIGRENAVLIFDDAQRSGQLVLDLAGKATINMQGSELAGSEPMVELLKRWDFAMTRRLAGL